MESTQWNVLFMFGPSGCGKTLLIEQLLRNSQICFEYAMAKSMENEEGDDIYQDIFDVMTEIISKNDPFGEKVTLSN